MAAKSTLLERHRVRFCVSCKQHNIFICHKKMTLKQMRLVAYVLRQSRVQPGLLPNDMPLAEARFYAKLCPVRGSLYSSTAAHRFLCNQNPRHDYYVLCRDHDNMGNCAVSTLRRLQHEVFNTTVRYATRTRFMYPEDYAKRTAMHASRLDILWYLSKLNQIKHFRPRALQNAYSHVLSAAASRVFLKSLYSKDFDMA